MMKKTLKLASLTFLMFGCAVASEFRPSLVADRGPQRLDMNVEREGDSNWEFDMYSVMYTRDANKEFTKHGTSTGPLSALIFGADNFKVSSALSAEVPGITSSNNNLSTAFSEQFNVNLNSQYLYPRVTYSEVGFNLGGKLGYRVWDGKGTVGVKLNVPVKKIRMERDNNAETAEQGSALENVLFADQKEVTIPWGTNQPGASADATTVAAAQAQADAKKLYVNANLYRLSAVKDLPFIRDGILQPYLYIPTTGGGVNNNAVLGGTTYSTTPDLPTVPAGATPTLANFGGIAERANIPFVVIYNEDTKLLPNAGARAVKAADTVQSFNHQAVAATEPGTLCIGPGAAAVAPASVAGVNLAAALVPYGVQSTVLASGTGHSTSYANLVAGNTAAHNALAVTAAPGVRDTNSDIVAYPVQFGAVQPLDETTAAFVPNTIYSFRGGMSDADAQTTWNTINNKDNIDHLWLMTVSDSSGNSFINPGQATALNGLLARYSAQSAEQWLWMNGFTMQNDQRTALGDITINPYYDHFFSPEWQGGLYLHVLVPTGMSKSTGKNPYKARIGNDNHVELGGGANVSWQVFDWMNLRLDLMAAYALPGSERVCAPFQNATIKAVGPTIDVDIDYTRLRASLDTTLVHPSMPSLATTIGYDFDYKTKDSVSMSSSTYTFDTLANDDNSWFGGYWDNGTSQFVAKTVKLDSNVLTNQTERMSHSLRVESSWHAAENLSIFWGGTAPFAGQYIAKMSTIYGGVNVKF